MIKKVLILCAMKEEEDAVLSKLQDHHIEAVNLSANNRLTLILKHITFSNYELFITQSGMGNVNAAVTLSLVLMNIDIDFVILLGVAGALTPKLNIGDVVCSSTVLQHDYYSSLDDGNFRMKPGDLILNAESATNHDPRQESILKLGHCDNFLKFNADTYIGEIISGNEFVGTVERKKQLFELSNNALAVDMEASAVAQVANKFKIPFLIIKTIADRLSPDGSIESDFQTFLNRATTNAAAFVDHIPQLLIFYSNQNAKQNTL
ncbi:MAG: 5'-methylthioadenosine/S-adenosylhomocysteine nucleosidase [Oligoflexia bacterium]|nr:5'-methylthioadenosine/S-adenosylhomocysteine nucleosidase [Oligoflexia bacterium]